MKKSKLVKIGNVDFGGGAPLALIAGPCVIEDEDLVLKIAEQIAELGEKLNIGVVFKASFDKANRTSVNSYRGPGIKKGLKILSQIKKNTGLPVLTDVHLPEQADAVAEVVDVLQIPAFLCRQTDILVSAGKTGLPVNIKKGQFMSPADMKQAVLKVESTGNSQVLLTERGSSFGYNNLVVDMRGIDIMKKMGTPVVFDATHSVQIPCGNGMSSGGERHFVPLLSRAAVAAGVDAVFMEVHPAPENALCDGANSWPLGELEKLLIQLMEINKIS